MARGRGSTVRRPKGKTSNRGHLVTAVVMLALAALGVHSLFQELSSDSTEPSEVAAAIALIVLCGSIGLVLVLPHRRPNDSLPPALLYTLGSLLSAAFLAFGTVLLADPGAATDPDEWRFATVGNTLYVGGVMLAVALGLAAVLVTGAVRQFRQRSATRAERAERKAAVAAREERALTPKQRRRQRKRQNRVG